jgi:hypothetical protein
VSVRKKERKRQSVTGDGVSDRVVCELKRREGKYWVGIGMPHNTLHGGATHNGKHADCVSGMHTHAEAIGPPRTHRHRHRHAQAQARTGTHKHAHEGIAWITVLAQFGTKSAHAQCMRGVLLIQCMRHPAPGTRHPASGTRHLEYMPSACAVCC